MAQPGKSVDMTTVQQWSDGCVQPTVDYLVAEEPLEIRVNGARLSVTMRTPGSDLELAAGFLQTEGIIRERSHIERIAHGPRDKQAKNNVVEVKLAAEADFDADTLRRNFFAASSCGICGKAAIESIRVRGIRVPNPGFRVSPETLCQIPVRLREAQAVFERTGGLHGAALFRPNGELVVVREDVVGWALLNEVTNLGKYLMLVSGRGGFEIIQKCLVAGLPLVASVSAPSSLAVQLAREFQLTLVGFLRGRRFVVYAGEERLSLSPARVEVPGRPS
jgi:FdhD protein